MTTCPSCGRRNPADTSFCSGCGAFLAWDETGSSPSPPADGAGSKGGPDAAEEGRPEHRSSAEAGPTVGAPGADAGPAPAHPTSPEPAPTRETGGGASTGGGPAVAGAITSAVALVEAGAVRARAGQRPDLVEHLDRARAGLEGVEALVVVVGEFKKGKSTLVNALLNAAVCPTDADLVTAVPTVLRYGTPARAVVRFQPARAGEGEGEAPLEEAVVLERLPEFVSETANPDNARRVAAVEVQLERRLLRSGLSLVDTPGVGGLDSPHGTVTLGVLATAQAALFVTDASQELTAPEVEFLRRALERCPTAVCVVTKTDLYPEWRRIVDLNVGHLASAGLDVEVVPVSSFLRLRAATLRDAALQAESGFPALLDVVARRVLEPARAASAASAAQDVALAARHLRDRVEAEHRALTDPGEGRALVARLSAAERQAAQLTAPSAPWQQVLNDGIQDLVADVEHDLRERLRALAKEAEAQLDERDPRDLWSEFEAWLRREIAAQALGSFEYLTARAAEVAAAVGHRLQADIDVSLPVAAPLAELGQIGLRELLDDQRAGRIGAMFSAARGATGGITMLGAFSGVVAAATASSGLAVVAAPIGLVVGLGFGSRALRDERQRQVAVRRQQAKTAVRQHLDEVSFVMAKSSRDALRQTQRRLRDDFSARARLLYASSADALSSARQALELAPAEREARLVQVEEELHHIGQLDRRAAAVGRG